MKGTQVVGYAIDCEIYCEGCADLTEEEEQDSELASPIFAFSEDAVDETCSVCGETLVEGEPESKDDEEENEEDEDDFSDIIADDEEEEEENAAVQDPLLEEIDVEEDLADMDEEEEKT